MWILECDGDLFQHRRLWLPPGKQYLFGRTHGIYIINDKSVSRKHLTITVGPVQKGDGAKIYTRSKLTVQDSSKLGTKLDGQRFINDSRVLSKDEHSIQLGSMDMTIKISWRPVVLCFPLQDRQKNSESNIFAQYLSRLEPLDIKATSDFIFNRTTHVITRKPNVPKGLQALISGSYLVTNAFVDAVIQAASASSDAEDTSLSFLEEDFDAGWPNALAYVPLPGDRQLARPVELFAPNVDRMSVFEGYTFVISEPAQFNLLQPVILSGGGKVVQFDMKFGQTKLEEFVQFVKSVGDGKGPGDFENASAGPGVTIVRFRSKDPETFDWGLRFIERADAALGQRSCEQNEFLDAILSNDATPLRRPLEEEDGYGSTPAPPASEVVASTSIQPPSTSQIEDKSAPPRKRLRRTVAQSRFKGFDDFDASQLTKPDVASLSAREAQEMQTESQLLLVGDSQSHQEDDTAANRPRTRIAQHTMDVDDEQNEQDRMIDSLLPAAAKMRERRQAEGPQKAASENDTTVSSPQAIKNPAKKQVKTLDIREAAKKRRAEMERAAAALDSEGDADQVDEDEDISLLRNLVIVEEMEVPSIPYRDITSGSTPECTSAARKEVLAERWDDRWNGRKNFKKFRRKNDGQPASVLPASRRIIVALEEVQRKEFGIGEMYWIGADSMTSRNANNGTGWVRDIENARPSQKISTQQKSTATTVSESQVVSNSDEDVEVIEATPQNRPTRASTTKSKSAAARQRSKRAATNSAPDAPQAKRTRQTRSRQLS